MKVNPKTDNINENNCDFQLVHVGNDDESIHGATNFKKNTVNDLNQMLYESESFKDDLNHEDQHSDGYHEDQHSVGYHEDQHSDGYHEDEEQQQDSERFSEDHEEQQQENLNVDGEEEASVYDTHAVFEDDDNMIDGAYLANELTSLVSTWYSNFRRIPFNLRIVYILLFLVFTQLSFVEYRLYMLSRQTEMQILNQSFESFSDDLEEVCRPLLLSGPTVSSVPTVPNGSKKKQNTRHQRSNSRHNHRR